MAEFRYRAFITYNHADSSAATRLQRAIESYRVPARLVGRCIAGRTIDRRLGKLFRDREELSAGGELSGTIREALEHSEFLIVICSPAARQSAWVNLEIEAFRETHDDNKILCYVVGGEPLATDETEECFPGALGYRPGDRLDTAPEHVAADSRSSADGFRLARLKLIAGMLGVGLDELIQRDAQRRQRNLLAISAASIVGMAMMGTLALVAIDARDAEQLRRAEAEDLIEFMLTDLRDRLEDVGRLDVMDAVGEKTIEYYAKAELSEHTESALGRRARAFHLLGEVDDLKGDLEEAASAFDSAYRTTEELLARKPNEGERIYNHSQSVFWLGYLAWRLGDYDRAKQAFVEYLELAQKLAQAGPTNPGWVVELGHANVNLGVYTLETGSAQEAGAYFEQALNVFSSVIALEPSNTQWQFLLAQAHAWLADARESDFRLAEARQQRESEIEIYSRIQAVDPGNKTVDSTLLTAHASIGRISLDLGDLAVATRSFAHAKILGDELISLDPENTLIVQKTAGIYLALGESAIFLDELGDSGTFLRRAEQLVEGLLEKDQQVLDWQVLRQQLSLTRARQALALGNFDEAAQQLGGANSQLNALLETSSHSFEVRGLVAETHWLLGETYRNQADDQAARIEYQNAVNALNPMIGELTPRQSAILLLAMRSTDNSGSAKAIDARLKDIGFNHPGFVSVTSG